MNAANTATHTGAADLGCRVHAYCRVSTAEQSQKGYSLGDQEHRLREIAGRDHPDCEFVLWIEAGVTGSTPVSERPEGRKMIAALRPGDTIIAIALDRLFRNTLDALTKVEDFIARGVTLRVPGVPTLGARMTSIDRLHFQVVASFAEMERARTRERVIEGIEARRRRGEPVASTPPVGWRFEGKGRDRKLVPVPREQEMLALAIELRKAKYSLTGIAAELTRRGYTTRLTKRGGGGPITTTLVARWFGYLDRLNGQPSSPATRAERIKAAIAVKRSTGWKPGNPHLAEAAALATQALRSHRDERYARVESAIRSIVAHLKTPTYQDVTYYLNAAKVPPLRNAKGWYVGTVRVVMNHFGLYSPRRAGKPRRDAEPQPIAHQPPAAAANTPLRRYRQDRKDHVVALHREGRSIAEIADTLKFARQQTVARLLREAGLGGKTNYTKEKENQIVALRQAGRTIEEIAELLHFSTRSIYRFCARHREQLASAAAADQNDFATRMRKVVWQLQIEGVITPYAIAHELNRRGYSGAQGGKWQPETIKHLLAGASEPPEITERKAAALAARLLPQIEAARSAGAATSAEITKFINRPVYAERNSIKQAPAGHSGEGFDNPGAKRSSFTFVTAAQIEAVLARVPAAPEHAHDALEAAAEITIEISPAAAAAQRWIEEQVLPGIAALRALGFKSPAGIRHELNRRRILSPTGTPWTAEELRPLLDPALFETPGPAAPKIFGRLSTHKYR